jgi:NAD(P)-dependent dehydrogenase (short-subunit alcohol dehydrogenase family)
VKNAERVVLITGASSGFGLLTTIDMARAGFRVVATMRDLARRGKLDKAVAEAGVGERVDVRQLDVTDSAAIAPLVEAVLRDYGRIDVLVNNAGFVMAGFAEDISLPELRKQLDTNFFGAVALTQAVLPHMRSRKSGHVIMVSSISGRIAGPARSSYSASKFALEGWSEALRLETRSLGIRVVLVEPGGFDTDIWTRNAELSTVTTSGVSPYREQGRKLRDWAQNLPKGDPRVVSRLITRIAQNPNPKLRYLVGRDARLGAFFLPLIPWKWYERLMAKYLGI